MSGLPFFISDNPSKLLRIEQNSKHALTWGVFDPEPRCFLGTVTMHQGITVTNTSWKYTNSLQEISTIMYRWQALNKGLGTLAALALCVRMFSEGAHALYVRTSIYDIRAQKALAKMGFANFGLCETMELVCGASSMQQWWLVSEEGLAARKETPHYQALYAGRQTYLKAIEHLIVTELPTQV